jgi:amino acid adenylation domain-containing protein
MLLAASGAGLVVTGLDEAERLSPVPRWARPGPDELAYVIYTSGSTGQPKGVMIAHHGFANLVAWYRHRLGLTADDRTTMVASPGFDFSVWECWPALTAGASLYVPSTDTLLSVGELRRWLREQQITVAQLPTPLAEALLGEPWPQTGRLRLLATGGDRLTVRPPAGLGVEVVNAYGPTENSVVATAGVVAPAPAAGVPDIGAPIAGTTGYLLDRELNPVPPGVAGELYLGGDGLARGYLGRADLTADRFVPDPFATLPGARLYRTGDLARHRPDGTIDFLGRVDDQVMIRGHRVEPAEVTAALRTHPDLHDAYVTGHTDGAGRTELVAYVVAARGSAAPAASDLRAHLARTLPSSMLPSAYVPLDALPLTRHGKVDRRALPAPSRTGDGAPAAAATELERALATIWAEVLRLDRVGVHDSFFDLGGHSLLLGQVQQRLASDLGRRVELVTLFAHPTVSALARHLGGPGEPDAVTGPVGERQRAGRDRLRQRRGQRTGSGR